MSTYLQTFNRVKEDDIRLDIKRYISYGEALSALRTDYSQIYVELRNTLDITVKDGQVKHLERSLKTGASLRAFKDGRWAFVAFDDMDNFDKKFRLLKENLKLAPKRRSSAGLILLPPTELSFCFEQPSPYTLQDRIGLIMSYDTPLSGRGLKRTFNWSETVLERFILTSEGRRLYERRLILSLLVTLSKESEGRVETQYRRFGGTNDWYSVTDLTQHILDMADAVEGNLRAEPAPSGRFDVIVDPLLAGVFIHEAFGHLSEADHHLDDPKLKELFYVGREIGIPQLNVRESGMIWSARGYLPFDDEGVVAEDVWLIRNGVIKGFLHSRETAVDMRSEPTGNARLQDYTCEPIVRMRVTIIEPGEHKFEQMLSSVDNGLLLKASRGGQTQLDNFTFSASEAFIIKGGKVRQRVRDAMLTGNVFETLRKIEMIGDTQGWFNGTCGKMGQSVPVSSLAPYLLIRDVEIAGG